jgi:hypothetical protein
MCAYCGAQWRASQLKKDRAGNLYCPDEGDGLDAVALSELNAAQARDTAIPTSTAGGRMDHQDNPATDGSDAGTFVDTLNITMGDS